MKEIMQRYMAQSEKDRTFLQILLQCAPMLTGDKPACIMTVTMEQSFLVHAIAKEFEITIRQVDRIAEREVLFLYHRTLLTARLLDRKVRAFLKWYGYEDCTLEVYVDSLIERYRAYRSKEGMFPHEMGVFLGYPLKDVKGFILNAGKGYRLSGYWKVYASVRKAKRLFAAYDRAKTLVLAYVLEE